MAIPNPQPSGFLSTLRSVPGQTAGHLPQTLLKTLAGARNAGLSWSTAWSVGKRAALKGLRYQDRNEWAVALNGTMPAWRAAYLSRALSRAGVVTRAADERLKVYAVVQSRQSWSLQ